MATVLKEQTDTQLEAALPGSVKFSIGSLYSDTWEIQEPDANTVPPQRVVVREIDMAPPGSLYPFVLHRPDRSHPIDDLAEIIESIREDRYQRKYPVNQYYRPLDMKLSVPTCFVFFLSSRWNWRFSSKSKGALLGDIEADLRKNYTKLRHVLDDNEGSPDRHPHDKFCKIIYFNANPPATPVPDFNHPFDLMVEFVYPDGDGPNKQNTIPIVIDPDIRHPGGSGE